MLTCCVTYTVSAFDVELLYSTKKKYLHAFNNYTTIDNSHYTIMCCKVGLFVALTSTSGNGCVCLVHPVIFRIVEKCLSKQNFFFLYLSFFNAIFEKQGRKDRQIIWLICIEIITVAMFLTYEMLCRCHWLYSSERKR